MMKYCVKLEFLYTDTVHVEADSKEEAIEKALQDCREEFDSFHDAKVSEE